MPAAPHKIPVTVLSGFLGSGKTTLLNHLLREPHGFRVAVVVNEFGEVGVDGSLVAGGERFVEVENGCICCALNEELESLLRALVARGGFDHILIETTGLADPLPVAWTFLRRGLHERLRVDALVTVADALNLDAALRESPLVELQIERADLLLLNKVDCVPDAGEAAEVLLRSINSRAPIARTTFARVPWGLLLGAAELDLEPPPPGHAHAMEPGYKACTVRPAGVLDDAALEDWLEDLPAEVWRLKGVVRTNGGAPWSVVHAVAGRATLEPLPEGHEPGEPRLVFIGRHLDPAALQAAVTRLVIEAPGAPSAAGPRS